MPFPCWASRSVMSAEMVKFSLSEVHSRAVIHG